MNASRINVKEVYRWPSFSHAVLADGHIYLSGMLGTVGPELKLAEGGIREQTRQALENIGRILEDCRASLEDLVKLTVYLSDIRTFLEMDQIYAEFLPHCPARTTVECSRLSLDAAIEIDAIAYRPRG